MAPSSSSAPMKILICLGISAHIHNHPVPHALAFSTPPRKDGGLPLPLPRPPTSSTSMGTPSSSSSSRFERVSTSSRLSAWPKPSDVTEAEASSNSAGRAPFFAQDLNDNYNEAQQTQQPRPPIEPPPGDASSSSSSNNQPISSVDARVLESILSEGKLNVNTEEEVKKLLDGPRMQEEKDFVPQQEEEEAKYNSKFVATLTDNKFWNSLKGKTKEVLDSIAIIVENRIELDSQRLAAVGIFTLDRIRRDIGRALPAAGRATRQLLLSTNSSYAEQFLDVTDKSPFALPAERSVTNGEMLDGYDELYEDLTTPADEIRQVTDAIRDILQGKEAGSYSNSRRGVRSFAPAGTARLAERQRRAYKARKQTVLKREQEGVDRKLGRAIGSVGDATWELRREMQTDRGREAGYRSRGVRQALGVGAARLLEAGRQGARLLDSSKERSQRMLGRGREGTAAGVGVEVDVVGVVGDRMPNIVDVSPLEEEELIEYVIEEANMEYAPDGLLSPQSFIEEKQRLIASLESCLSEPSETWLTQEVVAQATESGISLDGNVLRDVITTMVTLRDGLQKEMEEIQASQQMELKIEYTSAELRRMKSMVDALCELAINAAGESAAFLLKQELEGFVLSDKLGDIIDIELERMEQLLAEEVARREEELSSRRERQQRKREEQERYRQEQEQYREVVVEPERYVDDDDYTVYNQGEPKAKSGQWDGGIYTEVEVVSSPDTMGSNSAYYARTEGGSSVEVVSDTEYSEYEQQYKYAQSGSMVDDLEAEEAEENPATNLVLRALDVIFFVGEKFFLVLLPDLITGGAKMSKNYARASNRGRGSVGWKQLKNIKVKKSR